MDRHYRPQAADHFGNNLQRAINLCIRREPRQTEANAPGANFDQSSSPAKMRWLEGLPLLQAAPARRKYPARLEAGESLASSRAKEMFEVFGQAMADIAVTVVSIDILGYSRLQPIA